MGDGGVDCFDLLGQPRRPWLDLEALKSALVERTSESHPDRHRGDDARREAGHRRTMDLNAAHRCLREARSRLRHLIELETGAPPEPVDAVAPDLMDLFFDVGRACRAADAVLSDRPDGGSPIRMAAWMQSGTAAGESLAAVAERVDAARAALEDRLRAMNALWEMAPPPGVSGRREMLPLAELSDLQRRCSYLDRWTAQLREKSLALATDPV